MSQSMEAPNTETASAAAPAASPEAAAAQAPAKDTGKTSLLDAQPAQVTDPAAASAAPEAPEDYDLTALKIPELPGGVSVSPEDFSAFTAFAKDSKLTTAQAQAVLDYGVQRNSAAVDQMVQLKAQWENSVKADKELGGDKLTATVATANRAIKTYDQSGTVSQILRDSGYGSHPDVLRFLHAVGKGIGEDIVPDGGSSGRAELPLEERLYPKYKAKS